MHNKNNARKCSLIIKSNNNLAYHKLNVEQSS